MGDYIQSADPNSETIDEKMRQGMDQYLTFRFEDEVFGVEIGRIREVMDIVKITRVPCSSPMMKGVINLRGLVLAVADIKPAFGIKSGENGPDSCIIVIDLELEPGEFAIVGIISDQVLEVMEMPAASMDRTPGIGAMIRPEFVKGVGKRGGHFFMVLDIDNIFRAIRKDEPISFEKKIDKLDR